MEYWIPTSPIPTSCLKRIKTNGDVLWANWQLKGNYKILSLGLSGLHRLLFFKPISYSVRFVFVHLQILCAGFLYTRPTDVFCRGWYSAFCSFDGKQSSDDGFQRNKNLYEQSCNNVYSFHTVYEGTKRLTWKDSQMKQAPSLLRWRAWLRCRQMWRINDVPTVFCCCVIADGISRAHFAVNTFGPR